MNLKLKSDFSDYYDSAFDLTGKVFSRMMSDGPKRSDMFKQFKELGLSTPKFGLPEQLYQQYFTSDDLVVAHYDENAHCGEGKVIKKLGEVSPNIFCVEYIHTELDIPVGGYKSKSTRHLFIGEKYFIYSYISYNDWRSNWNEVVISTPIPMYKIPSWRYKIKEALFGIDFIDDVAPKAIDFNVSPGIYDIGIKKFMSSALVVLSLKDWLTKHA